MKMLCNLLMQTEANWTNPFEVEELELISISTGATAPTDVSADLLSAQRKGDEAYHKFKDDRIEKGEKFYDQLPRLNHLTASINGKKPRNLGAKKLC